MSVTKGNIKLGSWIHGWSIPALKTCPGASPVCRKVCYALRRRFKSSAVQLAHQRNQQLAKSPNFVAFMNEEIRRLMVLVMRVHVAGDFYNKRYTSRWIRIVGDNPQTRFFAFTRSWTEPKLLPLLSELGRMPNFELWFSWDRSMSFPVRRKSIRTCYLSLNDSDLPKRKTDMIFRENQTTVLKHDNRGNQVCPYDNGITPITCSKCQLCWTSDKNPRTSLLELLSTTEDVYA